MLDQSIATIRSLIPDTDNAGATDRERGRDADSPWRMPPRAWVEVAARTWREAGQDQVGLVAAGVAFYGFLALVPLLGAMVLTYGLIAEPSDLVRHLQLIASLLPEAAARLIGEELSHLVESSSGKKGMGLLIALAVALFGARNGAGAVIAALNIAYEEEENRGFIKVTLLALAATVATVALGLLAAAAIAATTTLAARLIELPPIVLGLGRFLLYMLLATLGAAAAATIYRYGAARQNARWVWLTPGSILAGICWLLLTLGFGLYVSKIAKFDATYGSLGGVVALLTWLYLSSYVLIFGAELNSELEHQTARDSTDGAPAPLGARGAWVADHVAGEGEGEQDGGEREGPAAEKDAPEPQAARQAAPAPGPTQRTPRRELAWAATALSLAAFIAARRHRSQRA